MLDKQDTFLFIKHFSYPQSKLQFAAFLLS